MFCGRYRLSHICCFFFFKQKTAYELRISDWSSDVCSSDLLEDRRGALDQRLHLDGGPGILAVAGVLRLDPDRLCVPRGDAVPGSIAGMVGASGRDDMEDARRGEEELRQGAGKIRSAIADPLAQALLAFRASVMVHDAEHVAHLPAAAEIGRAHV